MKEQKSQVDRLISRVRHNPVTALVLLLASIVIGFATFTDAVKKLVNLVSRSVQSEEARVELGKLSLSYSPDDFVNSARVGDLAAVKLFLAAGMDPNIKGSKFQSNTALIEAVHNGHAAVIKVLLEAKANVNLKNYDGSTALIEAVIKKDTETLSALVRAGATVETIDRAFVVAADRGNTDMLRMLWEKGIDRDKVGREALVSVAQGYRINDEEANRTVRFLLSLGVDVNARDDGYTALQRAARGGKSLVAKTLLDAGADINATCDCKESDRAYTPLMLATIYEYHDLFQLLLAKGADVNKRNDYDGRTVLMFAAYRDEATIRAVLGRSPRLNDRDNDGETALAIAQESLKEGHSSRGVVRALREAGAK